ncbi:MAG: glycosyltransferase family 4 protein [Anaerolineales bacterium]|nr:glycosyltransferase family 4 protein [Anaerolineales bacterium]
MHILIVHQAFAALDEPGGTRHHELARHLVTHGHTVTVIASALTYLTGSAVSGRVPWKQEQDGGEGITILRAYTYNALHKSFFHRLLSFFSFMFSSFLIGLGVKNVDVVWGTSPPIFQGLTAWMLARLKGARFLFEIRDLWPEFAVAVGVLTNPVLIGMSERLERFLYRRADQLVVNSPGFIDHLSARGGTDIALIPNGAEASMFSPEDVGADLRLAHGLAGKFVVLYAGAHGMSNHLEIVLQAAARLADQPEIRIVLLGDGKEKANLIVQAEAMRLENLLFLPPLPKAEMRRALAIGDACLAILKPVEMYKTVYPNKVFDYMAAGRATILAIDGVIREVIEAGEAGVFVPPGDPDALAEEIRSLASQPEYVKQMGLNARRYLEAHFNRPRVAADLDKLLRSLISNDQRR